jgi:patatin-related protein
VRTAQNNSSGTRRELRLALVLYGGVSLCIYMHGTTKEINRLVSASATLALANTGAGEQAPSEALYGDLLAWKAEHDGVRTDVVVDVIAGTSAGGINGVYLAKALAGNRSQDGLRELWLAEADIKLLLRGSRRLPLRLRALQALAGLVSTPALRGDIMSKLLYRALAAMDEESPTAPSAPGSLVPVGTTLDLLVTTTDFYGYNRQAPIWDPRSVHDEQHRHVFHFTAANPGGGLGAQDSLALAFAARATSCFPGAFEPVNRETFKRVVGSEGVIPDAMFRTYELAGANPDQTFFIDGGVLDNRPFGPAIEAIRAKPAAVDVTRTLIYLDPDPPAPLPRAPGRLPGVIPTVFGSIAGLPRRQPILDSLLEIDRLNMRVAEIQEVIRASFHDIAAVVREYVADPTVGLTPEQERRLHTAARERAELAYPTYMRLRVGATLGALAGVACVVRDYPPESTHAMLLAASWQAWGGQNGLFERCLAEREGQPELLRSLDFEFLRRRLSFTLAGVNWLYDHSPQMGEDERRRVDIVKQRLWGAILGLRAVVDETSRALADEIEAAFPEREMREFLTEQDLDAALWAERKQRELAALMDALSGGLRPQLELAAERIHIDLIELTAGWPGERSDGVLMRYVGFALWDAQLFALEDLAEAGERDAIKVMRTSPHDATLLSERLGEAKLRGTAYGHFGAFFDRAWRENDYLVGRLDGAERLIRLLLDEHPMRVAWTKQAFLAILDEEEPVLKTAGALIAKLRERAAALPTPPGAPSPRRTR